MSVEAPRTIESYQDLRVWKAAVDMAVDCYAITRTFPRNELYGMTSQIRRASTSVAANIAEGYGRENLGSYIQFLRIAQGSLKELETLLIVSRRVGLLDMNADRLVFRRTDEVGRMLRALIRSLERSTRR